MTQGIITIKIQPSQKYDHKISCQNHIVFYTQKHLTTSLIALYQEVL